MESKKIQEILNLVMSLNDKYDTFFDFSGHVQLIHIRILPKNSDYREGGTSEYIFERCLYIDGELKCSDEDLDNLIIELSNIL